MAQAAIAPGMISLEEYLETSYRPDADYVDGFVEERNLGDRDHSDLQSWFVSLLGVRANWPYFLCRTELRTRVSATRVRIPDVALLRAGVPRERVVSTAPLLCIEVLSPRDSLRATMPRVTDYLQMGVVEVWVVNPAERSLHVCRGDEVVRWQAEEIEVPETPVSLSVAEIFTVLDQG